MFRAWRPRRLDRDVQRYDALCQLLALPDVSCLPTRGRYYTCPGDALKRDVIKRDLAAAYVRHRMLDYGEDVQIVSLRRSPLRLLRRSA